jgi:hypothetical protein
MPEPAIQLHFTASKAAVVNVRVNKDRVDVSVPRSIFNRAQKYLGKAYDWNTWSCSTFVGSLIPRLRGMSSIGMYQVAKSWHHIPNKAPLNTFKPGDIMIAFNVVKKGHPMRLDPKRPVGATSHVELVGCDKEGRLIRLGNTVGRGTRAIRLWGLGMYDKVFRVPRSILP